MPNHSIPVRELAKAARRQARKARKDARPMPFRVLPGSRPPLDPSTVTKPPM